MPLPWSTITSLPYRPDHSACVTTPSADARTGVPIDAERSTPQHAPRGHRPRTVADRHFSSSDRGRTRVPTENASTPISELPFHSDQRRRLTSFPSPLLGRATLRGDRRTVLTPARR